MTFRLEFLSVERFAANWRTRHDDVIMTSLRHDDVTRRHDNVSMTCGGGRWSSCQQNVPPEWRIRHDDVSKRHADIAMTSRWRCNDALVTLPSLWMDGWMEQGLTSHSIQNRSFRRRVRHYDVTLTSRWRKAEDAGVLVVGGDEGFDEQRRVVNAAQSSEHHLERPVRRRCSPRAAATPSSCCPPRRLVGVHDRKTFRDQTGLGPGHVLGDLVSASASVSRPNVWPPSQDQEPDVQSILR